MTVLSLIEVKTILQRPPRIRMDRVPIPIAETTDLSRLIPLLNTQQQVPQKRPLKLRSRVTVGVTHRKTLTTQWQF